MRFGRKRWVPHEDPVQIHWHREVSMEHTLEPTPNGRWRWEVHYLFDGMQNCMAYSEGRTLNHPAPFTVAGVCKDRGKAHAEMMRAVHEMAERARAANAHHAHHAVAIHTDQVRL